MNKIAMIRISVLLYFSLFQIQAEQCRICKFVEGEKAVFFDFEVPRSTSARLLQISNELDGEAEKHFEALSKHSFGEEFHVSFQSETAVGFIEFRGSKGVKARIRFDKKGRPITPLLQRCEDESIVEKFRIIVFEVFFSQKVKEASVQ